MSTMENFGDWLIERLKEKNMSQSELARIAGISKGTISNLVNGTKGAGQDSLTAIAHALKLPTKLVFEKAGLLPPETELTPKKRELVERLKTADDSTVQFVIEMLEVAVRNKQREIPNNINPKTTPR